MVSHQLVSSLCLKESGVGGHHLSVEVGGSDLPQLQNAVVVNLEELVVPFSARIGLLLDRVSRGGVEDLPDDLCGRIDLFLKIEKFLNRESGVVQLRSRFGTVTGQVRVDIIDRDLQDRVDVLCDEKLLFFRSHPGSKTATHHVDHFKLLVRHLRRNTLKDNCKTFFNFETIV